MSYFLNIDAFRQYYKDMISCKNIINSNADKLNVTDEKRLEALIPIVDDYGREMVKRIIANAIIRDTHNYSEQVRKWADNAIVAQFIYETDNVLSEYVPDYLSESAIEEIAKDLIEKEKSKQTVTAIEGTEFEVVCCQDRATLLSQTNYEGLTLYAYHELIPTIDADATFSSNNLSDCFFSYRDARSFYNKKVAETQRYDKALEILEKQYLEYKDEMLQNSPEDIFEACYKIAAVEDVYYHLTENSLLSDSQIDKIINSDENVLKAIASDWYEYGDYSDELVNSINSTFKQIEAETELFDSDDDSEME